ncbi:hypothetical protein NC652_027770 [Populus alba x Populus x berolinensis]|nr:hypothetical protein NC652_027770 [Populus alba x Populus x berolinensis]
MSGRGGGGGGGGGVNNNNGKGNTGISGIPAASRKMVQSLKEIVNCPEPEIYAMLKECNMDPNEAVNRLLSQDPFHEVKSKREKKKENKDSTDSRSRGASNISNRGGRGGADRYGRGGPGRSAYFNSNESSTFHSKPAYKKENGTNAYVDPFPSASGIAGNNINWQPPSHSDSVAAENKMSTIGAGDGVSSSPQPSPVYQSAWMGVPGQVSMADIVKMGRPQNKASIILPHQSVNHHHAAAPPLAASHNDFHSSENYASKVVEITAEPEMATSQHNHSNDEWPSIEQPTVAITSSVRDVPANSELYGDLSNLPLDRGSQHVKSQLDDQTVEDAHVESFDGNHVGPASVSTRNTQEDGSGGSSLFDNDVYDNINSYQSDSLAFENNEAEDGTSLVAANLQHLSLQNDDQGVQPEENNPSVIIPNHLQVHAQECSHLSFGSFGSGVNSAFSGQFASMPINKSLEETSEVVDALSTGHSEARNPEYYGDEHLRNTVDESLVHRAGISATNYDSSSVPQSETLKEETSEATQGNQYAFPSSTPGYSYENTQQLNVAFNNPQTSNQMQNIAPFSSVMVMHYNKLNFSL